MNVKDEIKNIVKERVYGLEESQAFWFLQFYLYRELEDNLDLSDSEVGELKDIVDAELKKYKIVIIDEH